MQYRDKRNELSKTLINALHYLIVLLQQLLPRTTHLGIKGADLVLLYTDVMYEQNTRPMMAFVLSSKRPQKPRAGWAEVSDMTLASLLPRKQQIGQLEALAALLAPMWCADVLEGTDIIYFCDNVGALAGLVGGHSSKEDTAIALGTFHLLVHGLSARVWGEHVESEANMADEPSRNGPKSELAKKGRPLMHTPLPELDFSEGAPLSALVQAFGPHAGATQAWEELGSKMQ